MHHRLQVVALLALSGFLMGAGAGCSDTSAERSVLHVVDINANQSLKSDVLTLVDGVPTILEDAVTVSISNQPHDPVLNLTADEPFGYVTLDRYEIRFESEEAIPSVSGALGWTIHSGQTIDGALIIVPARLKIQAPLIGLGQGGELLSTAHITFYGREAGSNNAFKLQAVMPVNFANWAD